MTDLARPDREPKVGDLIMLYRLDHETFDYPVATYIAGIADDINPDDGVPHLVPVLLVPVGGETVDVYAGDEDGESDYWEYVQ